MNDLSSAAPDQPDDDDEADLVPIGVLLEDRDAQRRAVVTKAANDAAQTVLRASLATAGAELRACRLCHRDVAVFSGFDGKPRIVSVATGGDHVELCTGISDDQRARLRRR